MSKKTFSSQEVANGTGLTVRQVQHHMEKNVVFNCRTNVGRGVAYEFRGEDIIKFLVISECLQFNLSYEMKQMVIENLFMKTLLKDDVKQYIKNKFFLEYSYFYLWLERPVKGKHEQVSGYLISNSEKNFDSCYFQPVTLKDKIPHFNGFKLEKHSMSVLLIDMANILRKQHYFLLEAMEKNNSESKDNKSKIHEKGSSK